MAKRVRDKAAPRQQTTAQRLDGIVGSARRIMRRDKGLNGDFDRLSVTLRPAHFVCLPEGVFAPYNPISTRGFA